MFLIRSTLNDHSLTHKKQNKKWIILVCCHFYVPLLPSDLCARFVVFLCFSWTRYQARSREGRLWLFQALTLVKGPKTSPAQSQSPECHAASSTADTKCPRGKQPAQSTQTHTSQLFSNGSSSVMGSCRIVCETTSSGEETSGHVSVKVRGGGLGLSAQIFSFQVSFHILKRFKQKNIASCVVVFWVCLIGMRVSYYHTKL